jgi:5-methylcytosine-specific restriction endonuclease McrA
LVGYTVNELINHLEKQFDGKMSWDNYGSYWDVDHRKPRSLFHYENAEDPEFKECWSLKNLQPLEHKENLRKGNRRVDVYI